MNIPTTIAELRTNVAACHPSDHFKCGSSTRCLVSFPLNTQRLDGEAGLYSYHPLTDDLRDPTQKERRRLGDPVAALAANWDDSFPAFHIQTRDEALAWIDWYLGRLED